ncbi:MAG: RDD family protein [Ignavibacteria bacterium]|nr:RDD family protein [Ignavibacteria bacterium]MCU7503141.1 RDD family protein [Ignavibacteria bacterium]MCU7518243.1 RDD family protein [Ignavibacteria bacterium]
MDIDGIIDISDSGNGTSLPKAGIFRRGVAFFIDHIILLVTFLFVFNQYFDFFLYKIIFSAWRFSLSVSIIIFAIELYFVLFEWLWKGKTPGKFLAGICVAKEGKKELDFYSLLVRNLLRCTYFIPPFFILPDLISILASKRNKRLGDIAAGTVCILRRNAKTGYRSER